MQNFLSKMIKYIKKIKKIKNSKLNLKHLAQIILENNQI